MLVTLHQWSRNDFTIIKWRPGYKSKCMDSFQEVFLTDIATKSLVPTYNDIRGLMGEEVRRDQRDAIHIQGAAGI